MRDLLQQTEDSIHARCLLRPSHPILVAASGGLDSMVLLDLLHRLATKHRWRLMIAHFNHRLRGRSSQADERLVRRTAEKLQLPIVVERADVREFARIHKISVEMAARQLRHDFLARTATRRKIPTVALAHHADDQLELFFLRLLRGSGGEGLAGMQCRSPCPANRRIQLVRPLLDVPKAALREYARSRHITFREDVSNASLDFQRNRIRHELIPLLKQKYQPALDKIIPRVMEIIGAEAEVVGNLALAWLGNSPAGVWSPAFRRSEALLGAFAKLPVAVQRRCIQFQLIRHGIAPEFDLVEHLRLKPERAINVGSKAGSLVLVLRDSAGRLHLKQSKATVFMPGSLELDLAGEEREAFFHGVNIRWRLIPSKRSSRPNPASSREKFDADKVGPHIVLRHWQPGDRFQPIGMPSAVKLQDIFTNQKVPRQQRRELVFAATAQGEVFWVEGLRISEQFKLTRNTKQCLHWAWKRY